MKVAPFSPTALRAHYDRAAEEGGERVLRTWHIFAPFLVEMVWYAGEECIRFTPPGAKYESCDVVVWTGRDEATVVPGTSGDYRRQVCIPRSMMAHYLTVQGGAEEAAFMDAAHWLSLMGRDPSQAEIVKLVSALVETWPDFYALLPDALAIKSAGVAEVSIVDSSGKTIREATV